MKYNMTCHALIYSLLSELFRKACGWEVVFQYSLPQNDHYFEYHQSQSKCNLNKDESTISMICGGVWSDVGGDDKLQIKVPK